MHGINLHLCSFAKIREIYTALVLTVFREECHVQFAINLLWFVRLSFMAEMLTLLLKVVVLKSFVWLNGTGYFRMWQNIWQSIARTASCQSTLNISLLLVWQLFATGICNSPVWITEHTKEVNTMFCTPKHHTCKLKIFKICYLEQVIFFSSDTAKIFVRHSF